MVQSADGRLVDLDALRAARGTGTRVVLDATQALGWLDADLGFADAVVAAGYKWLLSPRGTAWLALRPDWPVVPHSAGGTPGPTSGTASTGCRCASPPTRGPSTRRPRGTARRAPPSRCPGSRGWTARPCTRTASAWPTRSAPGWACHPPDSAIVAVRRPDAMARLAAAGVVASARAGAARLAFHLYNTEDDVDRAVAALTD